MTSKRVTLSDPFIEHARILALLFIYAYIFIPGSLSYLHQNIISYNLTENIDSLWLN